MSQPAAPRQSRSKRTLSRILITLIMALAGGVMILMGIRWFGHVEGLEFSPHNFQRRSFRYYEIPLLGVQIWPIERTDETNDLETHIGKLPYAKTQTKVARWDVVNVSKAGTMWDEGDASILCSYLDATTADGKRVWLEWSKSNRPLAKILWPSVIRLADKKMYIFIPDLMELVRSSSDPQACQQAVNQLVAARYTTLAEKQQAIGKHEVAVGLLTEALSFHAASETTLRKRAESYQELGETTKAAADLAKAEQLARRAPDPAR